MSWGKSCHSPCGASDGGFPKLKDMIAHDVGSGAVFFSLNDFGEWHDIDGRRMVCLVERITAAPYSDGISGRTMSRSPNDVGRSIARTYTRETMIVVRASDYGPKPAVGYVLLLDATYRLKLTSITEDHGVFTFIGKEHDT